MSMKCGYCLVQTVGIAVLVAGRFQRFATSLEGGNHSDAEQRIKSDFCVSVLTSMGDSNGESGQTEAPAVP